MIGIIQALFVDLNTLESRLTQIKTDPLPGKAALTQMAPVTDERYYSYRHADSKEAAVLALIYPKDGVLHLGYMRRTSQYKDDKHAGQISFPGGKKEASDTSYLECALREANEEFGIVRDQISIIRELSPVYVFVSKFLVYPYLAYSRKRPDFVLEQAEVAELLEVPLSHLMDTEKIKRKDLKIRNHSLPNVPYYDVLGHVLWGATAMMTAEILALLQSE